MHRQSEKLVKWQYFRIYNMVNFGALRSDICWRVWAPQQISTGFASWLCYCSDVVHRRPTKICTMFGRLLGWYTIYTFSGNFACWRNLAGANFTLHPSLAFSCTGNVTARHSSSGRQPNFAALYKEWNYGTFADGDTYIRLGGHHVGHRPTFYSSYCYSCV